MHAQVKVSENAMLLACRKCLFGWIRAACNLAAIHSKIVQIGQKMCVCQKFSGVNWVISIALKVLYLVVQQ